MYALAGFPGGCKDEGNNSGLPVYEDETI